MYDARVEDGIKAGESEFVEFNIFFNAEDMKSFVAFANLKGVQVLIVDSTSGKVIEIGLADESMQHWINETKEPSPVSVRQEAVIGR